MCLGVGVLMINWKAMKAGKMAELNEQRASGLNQLTKKKTEKKEQRREKSPEKEISHKELGIDINSEQLEGDNLPPPVF